MQEGCKLWACTTDAGALAKMTDAERKLVQDTLAKIPAETSVTELEKMLGPLIAAPARRARCGSAPARTRTARSPSTSRTIRSR